MADLSVNLAGCRLANPVLLASGTCNYGEELAELTDLSGLGGVITKTITPSPRAGNPAPRIVETPAGMLNAIGLQNPGIDAFIAHRWPFLQQLNTRIVVNIAADTVEEFARMAARLDRLPGIAALEINISCPNLKQGGMAFGVDPASAAAVVRAVKHATELPVIVKLTPNVTDITQVATAVEAAGADAISLINTLVGMAVDVNLRRPVLGNITGGLSGPAIKPVALAMVWKVHRAVRLPVMGIGGIRTGRDALEFIIAGATAVQVGTATFTDPNAGIAIVRELHQYCVDQGISRLSDLTGSLAT